MTIQDGSDDDPRWQRWLSKMAAMTIQDGSDDYPRWQRWLSKMAAMTIQDGSDDYPRWQRWRSKMAAMTVQDGIDDGPRWQRWRFKMAAITIQDGSNDDPRWQLWRSKMATTTSQYMAVTTIQGSKIDTILVRHHGHYDSIQFEKKIGLINSFLKLANIAATRNSLRDPSITKNTCAPNTKRLRKFVMIFWETQTIYLQCNKGV